MCTDPNEDPPVDPAPVEPEKPKDDGPHTNSGNQGDPPPPPQ
jgi:hypothetical protein